MQNSTSATPTSKEVIAISVSVTVITLFASIGVIAAVMWKKSHQKRNINQCNDSKSTENTMYQTSTFPKHNVKKCSPYPKYSHCNYKNEGLQEFTGLRQQHYENINFNSQNSAEEPAQDISAWHHKSNPASVSDGNNVQHAAMKQFIDEPVYNNNEFNPYYNFSESMLTVSGSNQRIAAGGEDEVYIFPDTEPDIY